MRWFWCSCRCRSRCWHKRLRCIIILRRGGVGRRLRSTASHDGGCATQGWSAPNKRCCRVRQNQRDPTSKFTSRFGWFALPPGPAGCRLGTRACRARKQEKKRQEMIWSRCCAAAAHTPSRWAHEHESARQRVPKNARGARVRRVPCLSTNAGDAATRCPRLLREASLDRRGGRGPIMHRHVWQVVHPGARPSLQECAHRCTL